MILFFLSLKGSSAGAGSGEFHVYRHLRRKEYARQRFIEEQAKKEELDRQYKERLEEKKRQCEEKSAKKRAKRLKKKEKMKQNKKKKVSSNQKNNQDDEDDDDSKDKKSNENSDSSPDDSESDVGPRLDDFIKSSAAKDDS